MMKKTFLAVIILIHLFMMLSACAEDLEFVEFPDDIVFFDPDVFEDFADFDEVGTEEEYLEIIEESVSGNSGISVGEQTEADYKEIVRKMSDISGYNDPDLKTDGDYSYYVSEDETYCITSLYKGSSTNIIVPSALGGYPVKVIGDHTFENKSFIRTVEVPEGVITIGKQAFFMCINLQTVIVPEGVVMFGDQCFAACYLLDYVQVPDSLESVGEMAFLGCYALKEIEFGENLKSVGSYAFHTCSGLERITFPSDSISIDENAFVSCPENMEVIYSDRS